MTDKSIGPGTVLAGRFRLEDLLSENAGAKFWRATDLTLARNVAVNVVDADDMRANALLVAARTSATVTDGHFLRVLDAAEEEGVVYAVNEWGSGISLDKMLAEGPLPPRRAAWLVKEVSEAISTAHAHGVAHGRLVPENVMVTEAGAVKLIGFVVDAVLSGRPSTSEEPISEHESDVVNLAGLLYATLVGRWPGTHGSALPDAPREHGHPLRPRQVRAGVPRPLDAICDRVLNPEAHQELPIETAHEICAALSDFIGDSAGAAQIGFEPTSVLHRDELAAPVPEPESTPEETQAARPTPTSQHAAVPAPIPPAAPADVPAAAQGSGPPNQAPDPDATQAGAPMFFDDGSGVGWMSSTDRGLRSDEERPAPPPPPPLPELEAKPLFAPGPPRGQASAQGTGAERDPWTRDTGRSATGSSHGTGSLPPVWGPDEPDEAEDSSRQENAGKSWLRLAAAVGVILLLVFAIIVAFNLGRGADDRTASPESTQTQGQPEKKPARPIAIAGVSDLDPAGDPPEENPELAPLAVDGDPGSAWQTMTYYNNPQLGLLKDGVGLVVDLGRPSQVGQVQLTMIGEPTTVEILAAPEGSGQPTSTEGLERVAAARDAGPKVNLDLDKPVTTQYLTVWLTSLPPSSEGYQGQIAEIVVKP